jgi:hypothetical protein
VYKLLELERSVNDKQLELPLLTRVSTLERNIVPSLTAI